MYSPVKRVIKYSIAVILYYTGLITVISYLKRLIFNRGDFAILMYHRVMNENDREKEYLQPGLYVSRKIFEKQIAFLSKKYNLIRLKELTDLITGKHHIPSSSLVITFDDGWRDNYLRAFPILKRHGAPAVIFLTTDFIGGENVFWFLKASILMTGIKLSREELSGLIAGYEDGEEPGDTGPELSDRDWFIERLKKLEPGKITAILKDLSTRNKQADDILKEGNSMLTWEEVLEMSKEGIDFGSHGCSHRIMPGLSDAEIKRELTESKSIIERELGGKVDLFAYPNGDYDTHIKDLVKSCGYICALATIGKKEPRGNADLYSLRRINIHDGVSAGPRGGFSRAMFSLHILRNS
jgi:peptidoglycan/xylan/chitin deacetylase (PgdA/CDA1 family)